MTNTTFIWRYFCIPMIPPSHPAVYQYVMGGRQSKTTAIRRVTEEVFDWCNPYWMGDDSFTLEFVRGVCRQYLAFLEHEWKNGNIKVKEIYQSET